MLGMLIRSSLPITKHSKPKFEKVYIHTRKTEVGKITFTIASEKRKFREFIKIIKSIRAEPHLVDIRSIVFWTLILFVVNSIVIFSFGAVLRLNLWDKFAAVVVLSLFPAVILLERKERVIRDLEGSIPEFFQDIATLNESGLTIRHSLEILAASGERLINKEITLVKRAIDWGMSLVEAFKILQHRIESGVVSSSPGCGKSI